MKYLLLALANAIYGVLLFLSINNETAGVTIVIAIASVLSLVGIVGLYHWLKLTASPNKETKDPDLPINSWFRIARSFDIVLIIGLIFRAFVLQPFIVDGESMEPNFHNNQALLVDMVSFHFREPHRGEVIIFEAHKNHGEDYIKRIIAFPGETITIKEGQVLINGKKIEENYLLNPGETFAGQTKDDIFQKTLGENEYFAMGDNRLHSSDSRDWGVVPKANLVGRPCLSVYPRSLIGIVRSANIGFD